MSAIGTQKGTIKIKSLDDYSRAGKNDLTRIDEGYIDTALLISLPTSIDNQNFFAENPTGRMTEESFAALQASLIKGWDERRPVTVYVEHDGSAIVSEGNHRLHAAHAAGIQAFIEIRYFGNGQKRSGLAALAA